MRAIKPCCLLILMITSYFRSNAQNIGIGTTNAFDKLTIQTVANNYGITHTDGTIKLSSFIGGGSGGGWIGTQSNHPFHIYTNGSTAPQVTFHTNFITDFKGTKPWVQFFDGSLESGSIRSNQNSLELTAYKSPTQGLGGNLFLQLDNTNIFGTLYGGKVGIGDIDPYSKLSVKTVSGAYGITHTSGSVYLSTYVSNTEGAYLGTLSFHPLHFYTNSSGSLMTISTSGNVGIGTSAPSAKLHIASNGEALRLSGTSSYLSLYNGIDPKGFLWNSGTNHIELGTSSPNTNGNLYFSIKGVPKLFVWSDGRVSVSGPPGLHFNTAFTVNGSLTIRDTEHELDEWHIFSNSTSDQLGFFRNDAFTAFVDADGDWNSFSDATLKENIVTYKSVLDAVKNIGIFTYHYKSNSSSNRSLGLIAQNLKQFFPEIVSATKDKNGNHLLGIAYAKTGVIALKAIQEQQIIIEQQMKKIEDLEKRLAALEMRFNK